MTENELSKKILHTAYNIHLKLGPGLLESVYEEVMNYELTDQGFVVSRQQPIPLIWKGKNIEQAFRADLIVENKVLVEIKSVQMLDKVHKKQVLTYLKLTGLKLGLLINFNESLIKKGMKRIVNGL